MFEVKFNRVYFGEYEDIYHGKNVEEKSYIKAWREDGILIVTEWSGQESVLHVFKTDIEFKEYLVKEGYEEEIIELMEITPELQVELDKGEK